MLCIQLHIHMEDLLTVKQVSILLKVHALTIRRYINEGKLKAIKIGGNVRISRENLQSFSESYVPRTHGTKSQTIINPTPPFSSSDALFRLKARGLSLDSFDK